MKILSKITSKSLETMEAKAIMKRTKEAKSSKKG
jgi:hypothetical protein